MQNNFWQDLPKPFFILAPMEDVTDIAFRHVIAQAGRPDVFFTEFTNSESYCHPVGQDSVKGRLTFSEDEQPIVAHIWGDKPEFFEQMSKGMRDLGFAGVDINMGCPAPNVFKHGRGSGLILRPQVAADLISASKKSGLPISVKTRLGHHKVEEYKNWLSHLFEQDIANLSIHLRTKTEMSKVEAHWELIGDIKALRDQIAPQTLLTINGDIPNRQVGLELAQQYGVDGVMIGRGVFTNPFAFEKEPRPHSPKEHIDLFRYHLELFDCHLSKPLAALRRSFKIYIRDFKGASDLRIQLMEAETTDQARHLLDEFEAKHFM
ncbi:tRNA-dihydrouridine synthase [Facklamia sp. DSM 111018]|uniref:tRNA-dihydrouridine synthase n=1 Tax=Facklamia lactis TaxID=2749967 RepID=A0ABS0LSQ2_9LACT|nr:tRNA-dihydrouridine synthase [Facklamia lactis]MBG9987039.1 tRNA-dihydrouridine synthase [Facklamia lactis]